MTVVRRLDLVVVTAAAAAAVSPRQNSSSSSLWQRYSTTYAMSKAEVTSRQKQDGKKQQPSDKARMYRIRRHRCSTNELAARRALATGYAVTLLVSS